jgi:photosystem II stability/assembly factor-like uncharacterized protein
MRSLRPLSLVIPILSLILLGQGCSGSTAKTNSADGGVYKTPDRGTTWVQKRVLVKDAKTFTLGNDPVTAIAMDPQDHLTVYAGTAERGIVMSLNGGDTWEEMIKGPKGSKIQSIAVDPKDKCIVYATMRNKIYKTENCGRDWKELFFDPNTAKTFTEIEVDWYNSTILFAGTSEGDIFRSTDAGLSWLVADRASAEVTDILIDYRDSRVIYVTTLGDGIKKSMDGGNTWLSIETQLKEFSNAKRIQAIAMDRSQSPTMYITSKYGILATQDGGETWKALSLTSEVGSVDILDISVNPRNEKEIQYITKTAIVFSSDQGATWVAKRLPSSRPAVTLVTDDQDGKIVYLGFGAQPKN